MEGSRGENTGGNSKKFLGKKTRTTISDQMIKRPPAGGKRIKVNGWQEEQGQKQVHVQNGMERKRGGKKQPNIRPSQNQGRKKRGKSEISIGKKETHPKRKREEESRGDKVFSLSVTGEGELGQSAQRG